MDIAYEDMLARLKEERLTHNLSQEDLGKRLKITQGHYSKAEQAIKRFTYYEVKCLANSELDLYYIYTGRRSGGRYQKILEFCDYKELMCYLHILITMECYKYESRKQTTATRKYRQLCRLKYITGAKEGQENVLLLIREYENQTQYEMADCLGIDIKKYRRVEKNVCLPDSELMFKVYSLYEIPPVYFLKDTKGLSCEIEYYLDSFSPESNGVVYRYLCLLRNYYKMKMKQEDR